MLEEKLKIKRIGIASKFTSAAVEPRPIIMMMMMAISFFDAISLATAKFSENQREKVFDVDCCGQLQIFIIVDKEKKTKGFIFLSKMLQNLSLIGLQF